MAVGEHISNFMPVFDVKLKKRVVTWIGYFSRYSNVQPYNWNGLGESFSLMWLNIGLS